MRLAPGIQDNLCTPCSDEFNKLKNILTKMKINFKETKNLVRGLDYYTGTVFEITHPALGGQDAIGAGGRYDNLVKDFGGPDTGAIGYALGVERIILALKEGGALPKPKTIFIAALGEEAALKAMLTAEHIRTGLGRKEGRKIKVITGCHTSSLKSQMRSADKNGARFVLILGENELKTGKIVIKDMFLGKQDQDQHMVDINNIIAELGRRMAS